jgi:hypothetical protein
MFFGSSVEVDGDTMVVGAPGEASSITTTPNEGIRHAGAVYVFVRSGSTWTQQARITAANPGVDDFFGSAVDIDGDTIVVGVSRDDSSTTGSNSSPNEDAPEAGAAYVFVRNGSAWAQQAYLKPSNTEVRDYFGLSVAVDGDTIVVGSINEDSSTTSVNSTPNELANQAGAAYVFGRHSAQGRSIWTQEAYLKTTTTRAGDYFGWSVDIDGPTIVVSATFADSSSLGAEENQAGAAYVFVRSIAQGRPTWTQEAALTAATPGVDDNFGWSVAISGDTIVVGVSREDSSTTGVNSSPNENAPEAGAAYVFGRNGRTWTHQAYLKASNAGIGDFFGESVAISGDTVVVGAYAENSSTTGVNSSPNENASDAGAAYLFERRDSTWIEQAYLKASNAGANNSFGGSVAVRGTTVIVGASGEDSSTTGSNSIPDDAAPKAGAAYIFGDRAVALVPPASEEQRPAYEAAETPRS